MVISTCGAAATSSSSSTPPSFSATGAGSSVGMSAGAGAATACSTSSLCLSIASLTTTCIDAALDDDDVGGAPVGRGGFRRSFRVAEVASRKRCRAAVDPFPLPPPPLPPPKLPKALLPPLPIHRRGRDDNDGALPGRRCFDAPCANAGVPVAGDDGAAAASLA